MTDDGLKQLAMTLTHNNSLAELTIASNIRTKSTKQIYKGSRSISISVPETKYYFNQIPNSTNVIYNGYGGIRICKCSKEDERSTTY